MAIIAFDFDGTITKRNMYPKCGTMREGMDKCIQRLKDEGHSILIFTCRDTKRFEQFNAYAMMIDFMIENQIPFDAINGNINPSPGFNPVKPYWNILVDDTALGWNDDWTGDDIYNLIQAKLKSENLISEIANTTKYIANLKH